MSKLKMKEIEHPNRWMLNGKQNPKFGFIIHFIIKFNNNQRFHQESTIIILAMWIRFEDN